MLTNTTHSPFAKVHPLSWNAARWTDGFWADAEQINTASTVPHLQQMFEAKDISHVVENFRICAGDAEGDFDGTVFGDGDFYKWMEAAVYSAAKTNNKELLDQLDGYIDLIGRAQLPDGYISTKQIIGERESNGISRLGDINDFEVYNFGHLFTAACLHKRITGRDNFLIIAERAAGYLENLYHDSEKNNDVQTAVCPSHYMGLMELYRTTGKQKYLDLAHLAIAIRDNVKNGLDDNQDRLPLKEHTRIIGHAVRANYLYAGVADLCLEEDDPEYRHVLDQVWRSLVRQKMYLTGGCGALYNGASPYGNFFVHQLVHQAYGYEYQLPNVTAYNETCASVGSVMWAYRMFQLEPKAEYFDIIERTMLNTNMASVSLDGRRYFYENMLRRAKELPYELIWPLTRSEYILSYCCPPNIARTIAESSEYAYTVSEDALWLGMYGANEAHIELPDGVCFDLKQITDYPYDGVIRLKITDYSGAECDVNVRVPEWVMKGEIRLEAAGSAADQIILSRRNRQSYVPVHIEGNCEIAIDFDMTPQYIIAHPLAEEDTNQAAVMRGPLVYCLEGVDNNDGDLDDLLFDPDSEFRPEPLKICGRKMTSLKTKGYKILRDDYNADALYQPLKYGGMDTIDLKLIPYFAWDNRDYGEMKVWMPVRYR